MTPFERWRIAFGLIAAHPQQFRGDFPDWLERNFTVWERFSLEASKVWDSGRHHYSQRTIWEYIRHETALREAPNYNGWKLNDWYVKDCARLYVLVNPDRAELFEFRNGQSAVRAA